MAGIFDLADWRRSDAADRRPPRTGPRTAREPRGPQPGARAEPLLKAPRGLAALLAAPEGSSSNKPRRSRRSINRPPDLAQMYMAALAARPGLEPVLQRLGLLTAGMYPGRNPKASMKMGAGHAARPQRDVQQPGADPRNAAAAGEPRRLQPLDSRHRETNAA